MSCHRVNGKSLASPGQQQARGSDRLATSQVGSLQKRTHKVVLEECGHAVNLLKAGMRKLAFQHCCS